MKTFLISFLFLFSPLFSLPPCVVVTGGCGYIGAQTCKALKAAGYQPVAYDIHYRQEKAKWGPCVEGDVLDIALLKKVFTEHNPVCVIHLAGLISVPASVQDPLRYYKNNFLGTLSLLQAMKECGVHNIIFSSTASLYGNEVVVPIKEGAKTAPTNPYARSKQFSEECIREAAGVSPLHYIIFRYFNAAGADLEGEIGQSFSESQHLLTNCLKATLGNKKFSLFGTDFPTHDGTAIRDYIHVVDLAEAHVRAVSHLLQGGPSALMNLGTGKGLSVQQVVDSVQKVTGISLEINVEKRREGDVPILIADVEEAYRILGWKPKHSAIDTIIGSAWRFYQKQESHPNGGGLVAQKQESHPSGGGLVTCSSTE